MLLRQAGTWDLGPFAAVITPEQRSPRAAKETKGRKIAACLHSWGKLWTSYKKTKNPMAISEKPGAKTGYITCPREHHMPHVPDTTKGVGEPPKLFPWPHLWTRPYPYSI